MPVEKKFYPYRDAVSILDEWFETHPEDRRLPDKLTISGISAALKAEKRAELEKRLGEVADVRMDTVLKIGTADPVAPEPGISQANGKT